LEVSGKKKCCLQQKVEGEGGSSIEGKTRRGKKERMGIRKDSHTAKEPSAFMRTAGAMSC